MAELDPTILIVSCCFRLCSGFHRTFLDLFGFCLRLGTKVQVVFAVEVPHWVTKRNWCVAGSVDVLHRLPLYWQSRTEP